MWAESASLEASLSLAHLFNPQLAFLLRMHIPTASLGAYISSSSKATLMTLF